MEQSITVIKKFKFGFYKKIVWPGTFARNWMRKKKREIISTCIYRINSFHATQCFGKALCNAPT